MAQSPPANNPNLEPTNNEDDEVWTTGVIVAVIVAAVLVLVLIVTAFIVCIVLDKRRRPKREKKFIRDFKISTLERPIVEKESPRRERPRRVELPRRYKTGGIFLSRPAKTPKIEVVQEVRARERSSPLTVAHSTIPRGTNTINEYGTHSVVRVAGTHRNVTPPSPTSWHDQYKVLHKEDPKFKDYYYRIYPQGNQDNLKEYDYIPIKVAPGVLDNRPNGHVPNGVIPTQPHTTLVATGTTIPVGNPGPAPSPQGFSTLDSRMTVQHHAENTRIDITGNDPILQNNPRDSRVSIISHDAQDSGFQALNPDPNYSRISVRGNDPRDSPTPMGITRDSRMSSFHSSDPRDSGVPMRQSSIEEVIVHPTRLSATYDIPPAPAPPPILMSAGGGGNPNPPSPGVGRMSSVPPLPYGDFDAESETYSSLNHDHRVSVALS